MMTRMQASDARLVTFLIVLMRDRLPVGAVESIIENYCDYVECANDAPPLRPVLRCNVHLEAYARALAARLVLSASEIEPPASRAASSG
ncbi:MAG TPA: hypothetical protein VGR40_05260 [Candidatus Binatus sp.]|nr:hypothetical protein [Candidatus Binatus sp.]